MYDLRLRCLSAPLYAIAVGILALNWCHHGVRTAQIKRYLVLLEQRHASKSGWESWLPANRIGGRLGSRWLISTKGAFIGSQMAGAGGGFLLSEEAMVSPLFFTSVLAIIVTGALLFTNPRE